jgi:hypothetical protein
MEKPDEPKLLIRFDPFFGRCCHADPSGFAQNKVHEESH